MLRLFNPKTFFSFQTDLTPIFHAFSVVAGSIVIEKWFHVLCHHFSDFILVFLQLIALGFTPSRHRKLSAAWCLTSQNACVNEGLSLTRSWRLSCSRERGKRKPRRHVCPACRPLAAPWRRPGPDWRLLVQRLLRSSSRGPSREWTRLSLNSSGRAAEDALRKPSSRSSIMRPSVLRSSRRPIWWVVYPPQGPTPQHSTLPFCYLLRDQYALSWKEVQGLHLHLTSVAWRPCPRHLRQWHQCPQQCTICYWDGCQVPSHLPIILLVRTISRLIVPPSIHARALHRKWSSNHFRLPDQRLQAEAHRLNRVLLRKPRTLRHKNLP